MLPIFGVAFLCVGFFMLGFAFGMKFEREL